MFSESYSTLLADLHSGRINHSEFLKDSGCEAQYKEWCRTHGLKPTEDNAELYFDMNGFEESEVTKQFIEPVV